MKHENFSVIQAYPYLIWILINGEESMRKVKCYNTQIEMFSRLSLFTLMEFMIRNSIMNPLVVRQKLKFMIQ